jgi:hypothetical protein
MALESGIYFSTSTLGEEFKSILDSQDNGIDRSFMERHPQYDGDQSPDESGVVFSGEHESSPRLKRCLEAYSHPSGGVSRLYPFQVDAIANMVYRPPKIEAFKCVKKARLDNMGECTYVTYRDSGVIDMDSRDEDIGMTVVNDLFTGSGKTLTSVLAGLAFARERKEATLRRCPLLVREQTHHSWNTRMSRSKTNPMCVDPEYSDTILIMCSKHLVGQWHKACEQAMAMMGIDLEVFVNPGRKLHAKPADPADPAAAKTRILIYDSSSSLKRSEIKFVPCIIVDEFVSRHPSNILIRCMDEMPIHGRLILVSADAGSVRNIVFGANKKSFLRKMIGYDNSDLGFDVEDTMRYSIPMMSTSVLPTRERSGTKDFLVSKMSEIPYEEYVIGYTPTLSSRLFGANSEMSALSGRQIFLERFGIDMSAVKSVGDIIRKIRDTVDGMTMTNTKFGTLRILQDKMDRFVRNDEPCPICLESYETVSKASLLNPCWHIFCDDCVTKLLKTENRRCPMCRADIEGHTVALSTEEESEAREPDGKPEPASVALNTESSSMLDNLNRCVHPSMGLDASCINVLKCIEIDARNDKSRRECYRIIMVVPDDHFFVRFSRGVDDVFGEGSVEMVRFQTVGGKRKRVTTASLDRNLERFGSNEGPRVKILFTTEGKTDSLTGLDFPNVDCLFSIGFGNSMQRLGRLTRISRFVNEGYRGRAVRSISMVPISAT